MTLDALPTDCWIDAHAHPHAKSLREYKNFRREIPVVTLVNGTCPADWSAVEQMASRGLEQGPCFPAYGVHPWFADKVSEGWQEALSRHLSQPGASLGEVGIDRWKNTPNFTLQVRRFEEQLELIASTPTPVTIHCLRAWSDLRKHFGSWIERHPRPYLLHAFGGNQEDLEYWLERGALFSFSPSFLHPKRERLLALFRQIPDDSLLVETDCPSMAPPDHPPFRVPTSLEGDPLNLPENLIPTYQALARERSTSPEELRRLCRRNFLRLLRLPEQELP